MVDSYIPVGVTGKDLQTFLNTIAGRSVHAEAVTLVGPDGAPFTGGTASLPVSEQGTAVFKAGTATGTGVFIAAFEAAVDGYFTITGTTSGSWVDAAGQAGLVTVEGTNDPAGVTGWSPIRMETANGQSTTAMRGGGTYSTIVTTRWLRVNCLVFKAGTFAANLVVFSKPRQMFRQNIKDVDGIASWEMTPGTGQGHVTQRTFLCGGNFTGTVLDADVWTATLTGSATAVLAGGTMTLSTGTTANSTVRVQSNDPANLLAGASNIIDMIAATDSAGATGCVKRWGCFDDDSGVFFEQYHDGTAGQITLKTRKAGVDTSAGALNGINNIGNNGFGVPVYNLYELQVDPLFVKCKQNGILVHLFSGLFPTLFSTFDLPLRFEVINSGGAATNNKLFLQNAAAYRLGQTETTRSGGVFRAGDVLGAVSSEIQGSDPNGTNRLVVVSGNVDSNSSSAALNASVSFNVSPRTYFDVTGYGSISVSVVTDVDGTLYVDNSSDGATSDRQSSFSIVGGTPFFIALTPLEDFMAISYTNGIAAQSSFKLQTVAKTVPSSLTLQRADAVLSVASIVANTRALVAALTAAGVPTNLTTTTSALGKEGLNTNIASIDVPVSLKALPSWNVRQFSVGNTPVQLDVTKLANRKAAIVKNHDTTNRVYLGPTSAVNQSTGEMLDPKDRSGGMHDPTADIWAVTESGGSTSVLTRSGASASGTATSPSNALTSDDTRASIAIAQTVIIDGYTAGTANALIAVKLGLEARKSSSPTTETVAFLAAVTGVGSSGSAVSGTVTAVANTLYVADVARDDTASTVNTVTGLGLTWTAAGADAIGTDARVSKWYAYGSPASNGAVTAALSTSGNWSIAVTSYSNALSSGPLENYEAITGTGTSYSDGLTGTALGMTIVGAGMGNVTHTAGSGATERSEAGNGTGSNRVNLAATTEANSGTSETYSGTFSGSTGYAVVAASIVPAVTVAPVVRMSYKLSAVSGATTGDISLSSTSDTSNLVDITPDRAWVFGDVPNIQITATGQSVTSAPAEVDHVFLQLTDSTGITVRVSLKEVAGTP